VKQKPGGGGGGGVETRDFTVSEGHGHPLVEKNSKNKGKISIPNKPSNTSSFEFILQDVEKKNPPPPPPLPPLCRKYLNTYSSNLKGT